jgi:hypothetical protein
MINAKRRLMSLTDLKQEGDAIARRYGLGECCYEESAAGGMPDLDAIKWRSLCSQIAAVERRDREALVAESVPSRFQFFYGKKQGRQQQPLENSDDTLTDLAA